MNERQFKWDIVFEESSGGFSSPLSTKQTRIFITDEQKELLDNIADIVYEGHGEKYYIVNKLKFKLGIHIEHPKND